MPGLCAILNPMPHTPEQQEKLLRYAGYKRSTGRFKQKTRRLKKSMRRAAIIPADWICPDCGEYNEGPPKWVVDDRTRRCTCRKCYFGRSEAVIKVSHDAVYMAQWRAERRRKIVAERIFKIPKDNKCPRCDVVILKYTGWSFSTDPPICRTCLRAKPGVVSTIDGRRLSRAERNKFAREQRIPADRICPQCKEHVENPRAWNAPINETAVCLVCHRDNTGHYER
jgi:hypothetical protein